MNTGDITPLQRSILKELGSIGTAHAATALAKMTSHRISVMPTEMFVVPLREVYTIFSDIQELQVGIYCRMLEGVKGCVIFFVPKGKSYALVDMIAGRKDGETKVLEEMEQSILCEMGNIVCASYVNAVAALAKMTINLSIPKIIFDQRGQVLETILTGLFPPETKAIMIENQFSMLERMVSGYFLFVPRTEDLDRLFTILEAHVR